MPEEATLNTDQGSSSAREGDLISTVDQAVPVDTTPAEEQKTEDPKTVQAEAGDAAEKDGEPAGDDGKGDDGGGEDKLPPFHEHPRFQQIVKENRALKEQLSGMETKIDALNKPAIESDLKDMSGMSDDEIEEWRIDNPREFYANLRALAKADVMTSVNDEMQKKAQETEMDNVVKTLDEFSSQHTDFDPMWDDGTIPKFMKEHPGHNAISAYHALTGDKTTQAKIDEAVAKAVKEKEAEMLKNFKAKREQVVLGSGPSAPRSGGELAPELKEPNKFGGRTAVLAARLAERRRAQAG